MQWIQTTLTWYIFLATIGIIFFPITKKIFSSFTFDIGFPFAKTIGVLILSYSIFVLGVLKFVTFSQSNLILILFVAAIVQLIFFRKHRLSKTQVFFIIFEETLFIAALFFWTYVRGQEPSIHGLEKFMDFGFMNSILRATSFPPLDIWFSGFPINYYYFGHLSGAVLIRLTDIKPSIGYNLILSSIFALGVTQVFSLVIQLVGFVKNKFSVLKLIILGLIGSFIVNLGGNLHTIYLFTKGYPNEHPVPFWEIFGAAKVSTYWYPNATRFIPYTIHEFPSYSYVVADLHGHVFDIPFVLLTLSILFIFFTSKKPVKFLTDLPFIIGIGALTAIHYMTNAFDGPIYLLLTAVIFLVRYRLTYRWAISLTALIVTFFAVSYPFSAHFAPFVSGIGVNCSPDFLVSLHKIGPFLFEKDKCQVSPLWMIGVLWGFFWINFIILLFIRFKTKTWANPVQVFSIIIFYFGTLLIFIPEFFYIKDIYPMHFRANTMFKLGYQAFIMMGVMSAYTLSQIPSLPKKSAIFMTIIFTGAFFLISLYPLLSTPSYYGRLSLPVQLDGDSWLKSSQDLSQDYEIIDFLNSKIKGQPTILEAQGDSYTDFERISAYTGLPTMAGWWVHEWLWRGSPDIVAARIPAIEKIYQSTDIAETKRLLHEFQVKYVVISELEKQKYPKLNVDKWTALGRQIFKTTNGKGIIYEVIRP